MLTRLGVAAGLLLLVVAVYHPVAGHDFVDLDDYVSIVTHPAHQAPLSPESIGSALTRPYHLNWIPLTSLSLQLDVALFGIASGPIHAVNAGLHALASLLLWLGLARLTGALWPSAFVAAVFAVHPLHVESVAWATQRKDVLAGLFFGLSLWSYARYVERPGIARWLGVTASLALGLLSKPTLVTAPFVLLLLDVWPLRRLPGQARRALLEKLPWIALAAAAAAVTWVVQEALGAMDTLSQLPLGVRVGNAGLAYLAYLRDAVWPVALLVDYPHPGDGISAVAAMLAWAVLAATSLAAWRLRASQPQLLVGWLWYLGMLVPMIGLLQVGLQGRADRYTYLPLTGVAIALAWSVAAWAGDRAPRRVVAALGAALVLGLLTVAAQRQVGHWRDTFTLFEHAVALEPDHLVAQHRLAVAHGRAGDLARAGRHYAEVFRLEPEQARPHFEWASLLEQNGRLGEAVEEYAAGLRLRPGYGRGHAHLAVALRRAGREQESLPHFAEAIRQHPNRADLRKESARALTAVGRFAEAIAELRAWRELDPRADSARNDLAWALATCPEQACRNPTEAYGLIVPLVRRQPRAAHVLDTYAAVQASAGRFEKAAATQRRAVEHATDAESRRAYEERLALYERGEPYIERR